MSIVLNGTSGLTANSGTLISASTIGVGGATPAASGAGISFPATQSASTDANTLDDYEEGTWTPNQGGGLTVVGAFASSGSYVKIGRVITVTGKINPATTVAVTAGSAISTNLPFTAENLAQAGMGGLTNNALTTTAATWVSQNSTSIYATTAVTATSAIFFTATYLATA